MELNINVQFCVSNLKTHALHKFARLSKCKEMATDYVPKRRVIYCFWCPWCWRPRSFISVHYLLNQWMYFDQTCIDTLFGGQKELVRFQ